MVDPRSSHVSDPWCHRYRHWWIVSVIKETLSFCLWRRCITADLPFHVYPVAFNSSHKLMYTNVLQIRFCLNLTDFMFLLYNVAFLQHFFLFSILVSVFAYLPSLNSNIIKALFQSHWFVVSYQLLMLFRLKNKTISKTLFAFVFPVSVVTYKWCMLVLECRHFSCRSDTLYQHALHASLHISCQVLQIFVLLCSACTRLNKLQPFGLGARNV